MTRQDQIDARNLERLAVAAERIADGLDRLTDHVKVIRGCLDDVGGPARPAASVSQPAGPVQSDDPSVGC